MARKFLFQNQFVLLSFAANPAPTQVISIPPRFSGYLRICASASGVFGRWYPANSEGLAQGATGLLPTSTSVQINSSGDSVWDFPPEGCALMVLGASTGRTVFVDCAGTIPD